MSPVLLLKFMNIFDIIDYNSLTQDVKVIILVPKDLSLKGLSNGILSFGVGIILAEILQCKSKCHQIITNQKSGRTILVNFTLFPHEDSLGLFFCH